MKKPMTILLATAMLLSLIAGCGQTDMGRNTSAIAESTAVSAIESATAPTASGAENSVEAPSDEDSSLGAAEGTSMPV